MAPKCHRVAVLGAGVGGLVSIKSCLEEGMDVTAYESRPLVGGVWSGMKDKWNAKGPTMYNSLVSNTSKSMTCFSDFPCPASYPPFLPHYLFQEYLVKYAEHFQLLEHIKFNTRVIKVSKTEDHDSTGRWRLKLKTCSPETATDQPQRGTEDVDEWEEEFDAVIAATGFYSEAKSPEIPGLSTSFTGTVSNACSFTDASPFQGKTVLVVGSANSATDIAVEVSNVAKQVYLSVGDGMCLAGRFNPSNGLPNDLQLKRAIHAWFQPELATRILSWVLHKRINHRMFGLLYTGAELPVVASDELQARIMSGKIKIVGHLREFKGHEVTTVDGRVLAAVDNVINATGYKRDLSVLDKSLGLDQEELNLFKQVFPIYEKHNTLALVGCIRVNGPMPPTIELQSRLAAYTFSGRHKLPPFEVMKVDSDRWKAMARRSDGSYRYSFLSIMVYEELATEIGVAPHFWQLFFSGKPRLALKSLLGPAFPFNYRLIGPGAWEGAESAMDNALEENKQALCNRTLPKEPQLRETLNLPASIKVLMMVSICLCLYVYFM
ncbi:hypothetical protein RRG08_045374 [Elysia crispata]|uniref:Flavin-containing monooxygenase n=1 Tax=Elysia crispata TaxID=231223 RepID=A0AAE0YBN8_9GAST|nr:hypothetical protein RRG08_045374 [Elysia crispata]